MNDLPLHPAVVHLPLALAMLIPLLALLAAIAIHRGKLPRWAWSVVLGLQLLLVGTGFVAMQSGEGDEERVEQVVPESAIEAHEEAAEIFVWSAAALGALLIGVALPKPSWRSAAMAASTLGAVGVAALALNVGHKGGELVYGHGAASAHLSETASVSAADSASTGWDDDDDDDDD